MKSEDGEHRCEGGAWSAVARASDAPALRRNRRRTVEDHKVPNPAFLCVRLSQTTECNRSRPFNAMCGCETKKNWKIEVLIPDFCEDILALRSRQSCEARARLLLSGLARASPRRLSRGVVLAPGQSGSFATGADIARGRPTDGPHRKMVTQEESATVSEAGQSQRAGHREE